MKLIPLLPAQPALAYLTLDHRPRPLAGPEWP